MILFYADDPGALNFIAPLPAAIAARGSRPRLVMDASLRKFAADRAIECEVRDADITPESWLRDVDLLVLGTSEDAACFGHRLRQAARSTNALTLGVVDMAVNAANRFKGATSDPLHHAPDYLVVTDEASRDAYVDLGFDANRIFVCGHPHFDGVRAARQRFVSRDRGEMRATLYPEAPTHRPIWLFVAEGVDQLKPSASFRSARYTLHGRGDTDFRAAIVLQEIVDAAGHLDPRPWIVLKLHPKNRREDFGQVASDVDAIRAEGDPLPLAYAADLIIGMTSMLLVEACLLERPHLAVLPRIDERAWLPSLETGITPVVTTREQLRAMVQRVSPPNRERINQVFPDRCIERAVDAIEWCVARVTDRARG